MPPISLASAPPAVVLPDDPSYDTARRAWNLAADQRPAAVCAATCVEDVRAAVAYARERGLRIAAQATGHSGQALPDLGDTVLLKTALHDGEIDVDPVARRVRVKAGANWGDVVEAVAPYGLAAMHGSSPSVGVVGYLLGGGLSFYAREHGLAVNHVTAFYVVTADGAYRRVDADHEPDLFWALRGGGGGFAIVCAVELGLLPYREVLGGAMFWPLDAAPPVLEAWRTWTADAPRSVTSTFRLLRLPPLPEVPEPLRDVPVVCVDAVALDDAAGHALERRLCEAAPPMLGGFGRMPAPAVARLHGDPEDPVPAVDDGILLADLDADAADAFLAAAGEGSASPLLAAELRHLGGALAEAPAGAGVRGHLEGRFLLFGVGLPMAPGDAEALDAFLDGFLGALTPWATGTRFTSFATRHATLAGCVPDAALDRLARVRAGVDPDELLVAPHLVPPAA